MNDAQALLADAALTSFRLNGQLLALADELARPAGLTAAWWQVRGAVLGEPRSVSEIAREMGLTRQSVQRVADLVVARGLAAYADNPAHRRAKLVTLTGPGRDAIARIDPQHATAAAALVRELGAARLREVLAGMHDLSVALDRVGQG